MEGTNLILSSHYFPSIAYFAHLVKYVEARIDIAEHFVKQSYRNRCIIYTANGALALSIPVVKSGNTPMKKVLLSEDQQWKKLHWKSIYSAYQSSPFFEFYCDDLKEVFFRDHASLVDLNRDLLEHLIQEIGVSCKIDYAESYIEWSDCNCDLRDTLHPKKDLKEAKGYQRYIQIFEQKHGFLTNLSVLDLLFHEGSETINYLKNIYD